MILDMIVPEVPLLRNRFAFQRRDKASPAGGIDQRRAGEDDTVAPRELPDESFGYGVMLRCTH